MAQKLEDTATMHFGDCPLLVRSWHLDVFCKRLVRQVGKRGISMVFVCILPIAAPLTTRLLSPSPQLNFGITTNIYFVLDTKMHDS